MFDDVDDLELLKPLGASSKSKKQQQHQEQQLLQQPIPRSNYVISKTSSAHINSKHAAASSPFPISSSTASSSTSSSSLFSFSSARPPAVLKGMTGGTKPAGTGNSSSGSQAVKPLVKKRR